LHEVSPIVLITVITKIAMTTAEKHRLTATIHELIAGGMSMRSDEEISPGTAVEISFALLTLPRIWVRGAVSWRKPNKSFGLRFDQQDERRVRIKEWIEAYLEN